MTAAPASHPEPSTRRTPTPAVPRAAGAGARSPGWGARLVKIEPRLSPGRGRGVFATAPIAAGEVIERVCSAPISPAQCEALESMPPLGDYYFQHPEDSEAGLMLFGLTSLANHSDTPNARVVHVAQGELGYVSELIALEAIEVDQEVTHRYRCPPWFAVA